MLKAGIVGLPNVGKSTLFNALTRSHKAAATNYPFCTIDPNVGVVSVPDARCPNSTNPDVGLIGLFSKVQLHGTSFRNLSGCGTASSV